MYVGFTQNKITAPMFMTGKEQVIYSLALLILFIISFE